MVLAKGSALAGCVNRALAKLKANGTLKRSRRPGCRRSPAPPSCGRRLAASAHRAGRGEGRRGVVIAVVSTVVVFTALGLAIVNSPGWPEVKAPVLRLGRVQVARSRRSSRAFWLNVKLFCIAEVLILPLALVLAISAACPARCSSRSASLAIVYTDFFRGVPTILVIMLLGFGAPALQLQGVPNVDDLLGGRRARARLHGLRLGGLPRRHRVRPPEPGGAARSLGLSRAAGAPAT